VDKHIGLHEYTATAEWLQLICQRTFRLAISYEL